MVGPCCKLTDPLRRYPATLRFREFGYRLIRSAHRPLLIRRSQMDCHIRKLGAMPAATDAGVAVVEGLILDLGNLGAVDGNRDFAAEEGKLEVVPRISGKRNFSTADLRLGSQ